MGPDPGQETHSGVTVQFERRHSMPGSNGTENKLAYSIREAAAAISIGRSLLYVLIAEGKVETRKIGKRTVIPTASLAKLLEERPAVAKIRRGSAPTSSATGKPKSILNGSPDGEQR